MWGGPGGNKRLKIQVAAARHTWTPGALRKMMKRRRGSARVHQQAYGVDTLTIDLAAHGVDTLAIDFTASLACRRMLSWIRLALTGPLREARPSAHR